MMPLNLRPLSIWGDYESFGDSLAQAMEAFIAQAVATNHEILRHDTRLLRIQPCQNCGGCFIKEVACAFLDDFNQLAPDLLVSHDLVIFAEGDFSPALKNALSKSRCFSSPEAKGMDLQKVYLIYQGSEQELKKQIHAFFDGVFELGPETTKVVRYAKIGVEETQTIAALAALF